MTRQNRVSPFGELIATAARGTFMGNRGILHNDRGRIVRDYASKAWLICQLRFKRRKRQIMTPGTYTELFFLDEATALAAGHRPCFECRRGRALAFREAWLIARQHPVDQPLPRIREIDQVLHFERFTGERLIRDRQKRTHSAALNALPDGVFIVKGGDPYLVWGSDLFPWTPFGYGKPLQGPANITVSVLTPPSTVAALAHGYQAEVHESALKSRPGT